MALNLWKNGGQPTSYNPLPSGWVNYVYVGIGEFVLNFRAKSISSTTLRVMDDGGQDYNVTHNLTSSFSSFSTSIKSRTYQKVFLYDVLTRNDVIIEDIQLVQKPLPTLTINGIDGFNSGKWHQIHANAKVIDDETLELTPTGQYQACRMFLYNIAPNTTYSFSRTLGNGLVYFQQQDVSGNALGTITINSGELTKTFTTVPNTNRFLISWDNGNIETGKFILKKPMLNLGTSPAPYERKKGERMVLPSVKGRNLYNSFVPLKIVNQTWQTNLIHNSREISFDGGTDFGGPQIVLDSLLPFVRGKNLTFNLGSVENGRFNVVAKSGSTQHVNETISATDKKTITCFIPYDTDLFYVNLSWRNEGNIRSVFREISISEGLSAVPFEPYAVQLNKKPKKYVPKKNLFDGVLESGDFNGSTGVPVVNASRVRSVNFIPITPSKLYHFNNAVRMVTFDLNKNSLGTAAYNSTNDTWTAASNAFYAKIAVNTTDINAKIQLEEVQTGVIYDPMQPATPYEPYQQVLPKAKSGLSFSGTTDYFQLPSMTMDSIEIDCLIDGVQPNSFQYLFDGRTGLALGWVYSSTPNLGADISTMLIDGIVKTTWNDIPKNQRTKIKIIANKSFTDDVRIFRSYADTGATKGTIYKITCYLGNQVVATYDFENPQNIVGDNVIPNAKNLIPSFEDARWSLHANADVLGKDVLRLEANASYQYNRITIPVKPNQPFKAYGYRKGRFVIIQHDLNGNLVHTTNVDTGDVTGILNLDFTTVANAVKIIIDLANTGTGTLDFIKPQLYELTGKEGTIVGKPTPLRKTSKRTLYSKR